MGYFALHLWENQTIQIHDIQEPYEIAIVLGPFIHRKENKPNDELNIYVANERLRQSIELYKRGKFKKFLLSGNDEMDSTCFHNVGLSVTPFSVDYATSCSKLWGVSLGEIIPNSSAVRKWETLFRESLSMFLFLVKGYLRQSGRNNQPFIPPFSLLRISKNASIIHYASIF
ncbi:MAG: hypothetical protein AB8G86_19140 [Saprospiraceae bacterium]